MNLTESVTEYPLNILQFCHLQEYNWLVKSYSAKVDFSPPLPAKIESILRVVAPLRKNVYNIRDNVNSMTTKCRDKRLRYSNEVDCCRLSPAQLWWRWHRINCILAMTTTSFYMLSEPRYLISFSSCILKETWSLLIFLAGRITNIIQLWWVELISKKLVFVFHHVVKKSKKFGIYLVKPSPHAIHYKES